jgi:hypothetical protein
VVFAVFWGIERDRQRAKIVIWASEIGQEPPIRFLLAMAVSDRQPTAGIHILNGHTRYIAVDGLSYESRRR